MTDNQPIDLDGVRRAKAHLRRARQLHDDQGRKPRPVPLEEIEAMTNKQVYTVDEAAELLGMNDQTVRRWCRDGELEAAKMGRSYRISKPALEAFWRSRGGGKLFGGVDLKRIALDAADAYVTARQGAGNWHQETQNHDDFSSEPTTKTWDYLEERLGRKPTDEEAEKFRQLYAYATNIMRLERL